MKRQAIAFGLLLISATSAQASVYKCETAGQPVKFQEKPCEAGAKSSEMISARPDRPVPSASAKAVPSPARLALIARCEQSWPNDFQMQAVCTNTQTKAAAELDATMRGLQSASDSRLLTAMNTCTERWRKGDTYDFQMVQVCYNEQLKGREAMRSSKGE